MGSPTGRRNAASVTAGGEVPESDPLSGCAREHGDPLVEQLQSLYLVERTVLDPVFVQDVHGFTDERSRLDPEVLHDTTTIDWRPKRIDLFLLA